MQPEAAGDSLLANLAILYRHTGYLDRAQATAQEVWRLTESATDPDVKEIVDTALATVIELTVFPRTHGGARGAPRPGGEPAARRQCRPDGVGGAPESLVDAAQPGRLLPLQSARHRTGERGAASRRRPAPRVLHYQSTSQGTSLAELARLAQSTGLDLRAVKRETGSPIPVPAVVHWKADHFAALVRQDGDRFLIKDMTFGMRANSHDPNGALRPDRPSSRRLAIKTETPFHERR